MINKIHRFILKDSYFQIKLNKLLEFKFSDLSPAIQEKFNDYLFYFNLGNSSNNQIEENERELICQFLMNYFILVGYNKYYNRIKSIPMTSNIVDELWHCMLLDTKYYHKFCENYLGFYVHHTPNVMNDMKKRPPEEIIKNNQREIDEIIMLSNEIYNKFNKDIFYKNEIGLIIADSLFGNKDSYLFNQEYNKEIKEIIRPQNIITLENIKKDNKSLYYYLNKKSVKIQ